MIARMWAYLTAGVRDGAYDRGYDDGFVDGINALRQGSTEREKAWVRRHKT